MKDSTSLSPSVYRKLSAANIFGMLYFFIQDDIMDSSEYHHEKNNWRMQLALANLFHCEFLAIYRQLFPAESRFWHYFNLYVHEWCEGILFESRQEYFTAHTLDIAKKAAPVKLGSTAVLLLAGCDELIPQTSEMMDHVLVTLQMMDDWADWEQDLADGSYNCLLSFIRSERQLPNDYPLTEADIHQAVYLNEALSRYTAIASSIHLQLQLAAHAAPHLLNFHETLVQELESETRNIENGRQMLKHGGLHYFLSISSKK
ncbi:class 1 isoprenoid biosynthesis enzyme [Paenibacillus lemnae]|uniref:class 1 isoprenoid biosynthesis enzyme n=1 Tax=Paenibacillus lemnae TaxID=1330551 RepID=UPI001B7D51F3|nr:class 1 isoprenoid biosynthesis enzyme [Paenibacillus lemnae]